MNLATGFCFSIFEDPEFAGRDCAIRRIGCLSSNDRRCIRRGNRNVRIRQKRYQQSDDDEAPNRLPRLDGWRDDRSTCVHDDPLVFVPFLSRLPPLTPSLLYTSREIGFLHPPRAVKRFLFGNATFSSLTRGARGWFAVPA